MPLEVQNISEYTSLDNVQWELLLAILVDGAFRVGTLACLVLSGLRACRGL